MNRRVLIVDDEPAIHDAFRRILRAQRTRRRRTDVDDMPDRDEGVRFAIDSAHQGRDALGMVEQAIDRGLPYAVAFVDLNMPGWSGVETAERLMQADPYLHVVICTSFSDVSWEDVARRLGGKDRILAMQKPFGGLEVLQLAQALTSKWSSERVAEISRAHLESLVRARTQELEDAQHRLETQYAERERMEIELRLAQKLEAVGQLAAGIAHEINTPMQYVGDSVHFLQDAFGDVLQALRTARACVVALAEHPEHARLVTAARESEASADIDYLEEHVPRAFERTREGVERVSAIVRAMRELAHPGDVSKAPADLNHALQCAITVSSSAYKYVADLHTDFEELPEVECHVGELNQVFLNLIVNAAHAIADVTSDKDSRGSIVVRTRHTGSTVTISVADTGGGVPDEIRSRIFDPFFTTKPVGQGTGQGLALARSIVVDKHGGRLRFDTEVGRGTTFEVEIPIRAPANSHSKATA